MNYLVFEYKVQNLWV